MNDIRSTVVEESSTDDYKALINKPKINGNVLVGDQTGLDLGLIQPVEKYFTTKMDLTMGTPVVINLPEAIYGESILPKVFVDKVLEASSGDSGFDANGLVINFVPSISKTQADVKVFYPANPRKDL